jgi:predicted membrane channel-forming protein YqfA (hemolysin III family)
MLNKLIFAADRSNALFAQMTPAQTGFNAVIFLLGSLLIIFHFWMLINCLVKPVRNKLVWFLGMFFLGPLVSIIYYFVGRKTNDSVIEQWDGPVPRSQPPVQ